MNPYRHRVLREMRAALVDVGPIGDVLDVGAGDGWFAMSVASLNLCKSVRAIDVMMRSDCFYSVEKFDGECLPFADAKYDLVYAIDVVHHTSEPERLLKEIARCAKRYLLIKDHTWRNRAEWLGLAVMDEVGNRRFGVRSMYNFQFKWQWSSILQEAGFTQMKLIHPLPCHIGLLGALTNRLQYLSLWTRA